MGSQLRGGSCVPESFLSQDGLEPQVAIRQDLTKTYCGPSLNISFLQIVSMADMRSSNPSANMLLVHLEFPQNLEFPISAISDISPLGKNVHLN